MEQPNSGGKNKRTINGLFVRPKRQLSYTLAILSSGIFLMAMLTGFFVYKVTLIVEGLKNIAPATAMELLSSFDPIIDGMILCQILMWAFCIMVGVLVTHRIFGPVVPIVRHIKNLAEGDYSSRIHLRSGDSMNEIADALNELAETLSKKS